MLIELLSQHPMLAALTALVGLAAVFGGILGFAAVRFKTEGNPIVDQINDPVGRITAFHLDLTIFEIMRHRRHR